MNVLMEHVHKMRRVPCVDHPLNTRPLRAYCCMNLIIQNADLCFPRLAVDISHVVRFKADSNGFSLIYPLTLDLPAFVGRFM